jgi:quercetin dioxygenase-like cupin family protein
MNIHRMPVTKSSIRSLITSAGIGVVLSAGIGVSTGALQIAQAQTPAPAIKRTILQRTDVGGNQETILGLAEIAPGGSTGKHSHPGIETGYVLEGSATLEIEGMPAIAMSAGTSYLIAAGKVHDAKNTGSVPVKVLATYVVEKGKPLATAAP